MNHFGAQDEIKVWVARIATDLQRERQTKRRLQQVHVQSRTVTAVGPAVRLTCQRWLLAAAAAVGVHEQQRRIGLHHPLQYGGHGIGRAVTKAATQQEQVEGGGEGVPAPRRIHPPSDDAAQQGFAPQWGVVNLYIETSAEVMIKSRVKAV